MSSQREAELGVEAPPEQIDHDKGKHGEAHGQEPGEHVSVDVAMRDARMVDDAGFQHGQHHHPLPLAHHPHPPPDPHHIQMREHPQLHHQHAVGHAEPPPPPPENDGSACDKAEGQEGEYVEEHHGEGEGGPEEEAADNHEGHHHDFSPAVKKQIDSLGINISFQSLGRDQLVELVCTLCKNNTDNLRMCQDYIMRRCDGKPKRGRSANPTPYILHPKPTPYPIP